MSDTLTGETQVNATVKAAFYHVRQLGQIRRFLTDKSAASVVHAFITSRIDYCNSLYLNLPSVLLDKLQRVLNIAARMVSRAPCHSHITPVLQDLHWLPVPQRIQYKVMLLTFKALHGLVPTYLSDMLERRRHTRCLRPGSNLLLKVPPARLKTYGERTFCYGAARLWNLLPPSIQNCDNINTFKRLLKTKLFKEAFNV